MVATQLTITISGGGPFGIRLATGPNQEVIVDKVRKNGRADEAGLREGDAVVSVNGRSCKGVDSASIADWIDNTGQRLTLQVTRKTGDQSSASVRDVQSVSSSNFTVSAPSGVDVQRNADKSFTMTIGMPFQLDLGGQPSGTNTQVQDEKYTSEHSLTFNNYKKEDAQAPHQQEDEPQQQQQQPLRPKQLDKILSEGSGSEPSSPSIEGTPKPKKLFVDSAFYDDPEHKYPTVEEQIQLARQVAMSVISPANLKSKGHRMFMKRKERAVRWTTGLTEEEKAELAAQMAAAKAAEAAGEPAPEPEGGSPQSAPLSLPTSVMFAPKLPTEKDAEKMNAMSHEELERMTLLERKTTHTNVSPQVCFSLVDDLKNVKGKGGKLFAKRQARAEKWAAEKKEGDAEDQEAEDDDETEPDPRVVEKLKAEHRSRAGTGAAPAAPAPPPPAPVNRLKDMVETGKAAMTPWDAAAQYGSVDKAFEHLDSRTPGRQRPGQQGIVEALQKREGAGGGRGRASERPKSTIGGVGMAGTGTRTAEDQKAKIEALGGNPGAAGLASAMTASLAASRSTGSGLRSTKFKAT